MSVSKQTSTRMWHKRFHSLGHVVGSLLLGHKPGTPMDTSTKGNNNMARNDRDNDAPKKFPWARGVTLTGNLTADPREIPAKGDGQGGVGFKFACNSSTYKEFEGVVYVDAVLFGYWAEGILENFKKGDKAVVTGDLFVPEPYGDYEPKEGEIQMDMEARVVGKQFHPEGGGNSGGGSRRSRDEGDERKPARSRRSRDDSDGDDGGEERSPRRRSRDSDEGEERSPRRRSASVKHDGDNLD